MMRHLKTIEAASVAPFTGGGSQPKRCVVGTDKITYVAKLTTGPEDERPSKQNVNEFIGCLLGDLVGIDTPDCAMIKILDDSVFEPSVEDTPRGSYFGSRFMGDYPDLHQERLTLSDWLSVSDPDAIYRLHAFDVWLKIADRKADNVILDPNKTAGSRKFLAIDFGNALGESHWTPSRLDATTNAVSVGQWLFSHLDNENAATRAARHIARFESSLELIISDASAFCGLSQIDREAATAFLRSRMLDLERLVRENVQAI
jgi:hypothetical protein